MEMRCQPSTVPSTAFVELRHDDTLFASAPYATDSSMSGVRHSKILEGRNVLRATKPYPLILPLTMKQNRPGQTTRRR